jgi:hypothetical protein
MDTNPPGASLVRGLGGSLSVDRLLQSLISISSGAPFSEGDGRKDCWERILSGKKKDISLRNLLNR